MDILFYCLLFYFAQCFSGRSFPLFEGIMWVGILRGLEIVKDDIIYKIVPGNQYGIDYLDLRFASPLDFNFTITLSIFITLDSGLTKQIVFPTICRIYRHL